jgi:mannose-6-phosphate isomerase
MLFEPIFVPKPWGGRRLEQLGKRLPPGEPIGESWELVSLPGAESRVLAPARFAGQTLGTLVTAFGPELVGAVPLVDGRFPLLIKFLDAREHLSVQVHPKPGPGGDAATPGVKHEAWYVVHAEPSAELFIGLQPGVTPADVAAAANTPTMRGLLRSRPAQAGDCFYLPSGTLHALGAGIVVAEVQTPSDVTYRLYDWDRVDASGSPRALHLEQGLANIRYDVREEEILQPASGRGANAWRRCRCPRFVIDEWRLSAGVSATPSTSGVSKPWVLMVLAGEGLLRAGAEALPLRAGQTVLLPANGGGEQVEAVRDLTWLAVELP